MTERELYTKTNSLGQQLKDLLNAMNPLFGDPDIFEQRSKEWDDLFKEWSTSLDWFHKVGECEHQWDMEAGPGAPLCSKCEVQREW